MEGWELTVEAAAGTARITGLEETREGFEISLGFDASRDRERVRKGEGMKGRTGWREASEESLPVNIEDKANEVSFLEHRYLELERALKSKMDKAGTYTPPSLTICFNSLTIYPLSGGVAES